MALTNSYDENKRYPGYVGLPFPRVKVKINKTNETNDETGELLVKGSSIFKE